MLSQLSALENVEEVILWKGSGRVFVASRSIVFGEIFYPETDFFFTRTIVDYYKMLYSNIDCGYVDHLWRDMQNMTNKVAKVKKRYSSSPRYFGGMLS